MKTFFIVMAVIGISAMGLGILRMFAVPFGLCIFTESLFKCLKCQETCIWLVTIGGGIVGGFFIWLATKRQNGE